MVSMYANAHDKIMTIVDNSFFENFIRDNYIFNNYILLHYKKPCINNSKEENIFEQIYCETNYTSNTVIFLCADDIKIISPSMIKMCEDYYEIKNIDEDIVKKIYRDITNSGEEEANKFYESVKNIKFDKQTLIQFLLGGNHNIEDFKKIVKFKNTYSHNGMYM
jgi:hypothetical protein